MLFGKRPAARRMREDAAEDGQVCIALVLAVIAALLSTLRAQAVPWDQVPTLAVASASSGMTAMAGAIAERPVAMQPP
jgi:hypothetical protein